MQIHKFTYPTSALESLPKDQLSAFLLLGLFLNEANWLQKLLLLSTLDEGGNEAEQKARLALSLMLSKLLAAKIHEGWGRIRCNPLKATFNSLSSNTRIQTLQNQLEPLLTKDSIIHRVRRDHAFHYPTQLELAGLPGISQADVALYMTEHSGDTLSMVSELSAVAGMIGITEADSIDKALGLILDEIIKVAGIYCELLSETLGSLVGDVIRADATSELIDNSDAPSIDSIHLRFFANPQKLA